MNYSVLLLALISIFSSVNCYLYYRTLPVEFEPALPPVYVRHIPSPVKHEPNVPIINVPSPRVIYHSYLDAPKVSAKSYYEEIFPQRKLYKIKSFPNVVYQTVPAVSTHDRVNNVQQFVPQAPRQQTVFPEASQQAFVPETSQPPRQQTVSHEASQQAFVPEASQQQFVVPEAPRQEIVIQGAAPVPINRRAVHFVPYQHTERRLLAADIPLTHDGLTYEVARARAQHFAAIAAIKASLPPLYQ